MDEQGSATQGKNLAIKHQTKEKTMPTTQTVLTADQLHEMWMTVEAEDILEYSGRAMYGQSCLGIRVPTLSEMWRIASELDGELAELLGIPKYDDLGMEYVIYWPHVTLDWDTIEP